MMFFCICFLLLSCSLKSLLRVAGVFIDTINTSEKSFRQRMSRQVKITHLSARAKCDESNRQELEGETIWRSMAGFLLAWYDDVTFYTLCTQDKRISQTRKTEGGYIIWPVF